MKKLGSSLIFSPSDLTRFMENGFVTWMDRYYLEFPNQVQPDEITEEVEVIQKKGLDHERRFLLGLKEEGRGVCEIPSGTNASELTLAAMHDGHEIIYQAVLSNNDFSGYADFLVRKDRSSDLGKHSYEVWDTKLSLKPKPYFVIQLCCYAEILEPIQGHMPESLVVVLGDGSTKCFRTGDFLYYYLDLKAAFLEQQRTFDPEVRPEPLGQGRNGRWESVAEQWLKDNDHLSLVAGITQSQIQRLREVGIETVEALTNHDRAHVPKMSSSTLDKLRIQARLQVISRKLDRPRFEVVVPTPESPRRGLGLLPPPSELDIVFDIEGYPLVQGGLEYLWGTMYQEDSERKFLDWWAHDDLQEKKVFEGFIDWVYSRWQSDPSLHIYHYAGYELTAVRRLMGKYATREDEVDTFLRNDVFVDLYRVVHQGLRVGVPSYSLKEIEQLYGEIREDEVSTAMKSVVFYQRWLEGQDGSTWESSEILREIRDYNRRDCESTWMLAEWLRDIQKETGIGYIPPANTVEVMVQPQSSQAKLAEQLLQALPEDRSKDPERWRIQELLAWFLEFHRRELKPMWWRMFDRHEMNEDQLYDDMDCLAGLKRTQRPAEPVKRSILFEFEFDPNQDTKIKTGDSCYFAHDLDIKVRVEEIDSDGGHALIKLGTKSLSLCGGDPPKRLSLIPDEFVNPKAIVESITSTVLNYQQTGELPPALKDLLHRCRPHIKGSPSGPVLPKGMEVLNGTAQVVSNMNQTTLCIQGPPGTGKTHTAAHVILKLLKSGKRVGVSANSHKAICNLIDRVVQFSASQNFPLCAVKIGGDLEEQEQALRHETVDFVKSIKKVESHHELIGGTAWAFSAGEAQGMLDYLFIDEAGQVSVANLVGMAPSASNLVLVGDQMQLAQPTQGSHPGESGLSTLDYLLQDKPTIPEDLGIFLGTTWRLHPKVCQFISEAVYEGRLVTEAHTEARKVLLDGGAEWIDREAGVLFLPVEHSGNVQASEEEVAAIKEIIGELLSCEHTDELGNQLGHLKMEDILIVAPYNMQVRMLKRALGGNAPVGTIDKFQGQEAAVVIISMCASVGNASPRGIKFLFDKNRLNVAISRAKSLAIVVGHPDLTQTSCNTLRQMELINLFCRIVTEGAKEKS